MFTQIKLSNHRREDFLRFETIMRSIEEVLEVHLVSGGSDYLVKFMTKGISDYQALMDELLGRDVGIEKYFRFIVLKSPNLKSEVPMESILNT